jgi:hypothetical protein
VDDDEVRHDSYPSQPCRTTRLVEMRLPHGPEDCSWIVSQCGNAPKTRFQERDRRINHDLDMGLNPSFDAWGALR